MVMLETLVILSEEDDGANGGRDGDGADPVIDGPES